MALVSPPARHRRLGGDRVSSPVNEQLGTRQRDRTRRNRGDFIETQTAVQKNNRAQFAAESVIQKVPDGKMYKNNLEYKSSIFLVKPFCTHINILQYPRPVLHKHLGHVYSSGIGKLRFPGIIFSQGLFFLPVISKKRRHAWAGSRQFSACRWDGRFLVFNRRMEKKKEPSPKGTVCVYFRKENG